MFVTVPSRRKPRPAAATYFLAALCVSMLIAARLQGDEARAHWMAMLGVVPNEWQGWLSMPAAVMTERIVDLASALFVHVGVVHLLGNLVFLLVFGVSAEKPLGAARLLTLFVCCGMAANAVAVWAYPDRTAPIVGASGAVSALVGAYVTLFPRSRLGLMLPLGAFFEVVRMPAYGLIGLWVLVQALMYALAPDTATIAWPIHLAGFAAGVVFALLSRGAIARRLRN